MRATTLLLGGLLLFTILAGSGCEADDQVEVDVSGNPVTRDFALDGFDAIDASHTFHVTVEAGDAFSVSVTADDNLMERVTVEVSGSTLQLGVEPNTRIVGNVTLEAAVTMPALREVTLSGASYAYLDSFEADSMTVRASGASSIEAPVDVANLTLELSGASRASFTGAGAHADIDASGASSASLDQYRLDDADVRLSGASSASVLVETHLNVDLSGASRLLYAGDASLGRVDVTGVSQLEHTSP